MCYFNEKIFSCLAPKKPRKVSDKRLLNINSGILMCISVKLHVFPCRLFIHIMALELS